MIASSLRKLVLCFTVFALVGPGAALSARGDDEKSADKKPTRKSGKKSVDGKSASAKDDDGGDKSSSTKSGKKKSRKVDMTDVPRSKKEERLIHRALGEKFKIKHTMHYTVHYDTSEEDVEAFAVAIEATYRSCAKYMMSLGLDPRPLKHKMQTHFFNEYDDYAEHFEKCGGYQPGPYTLGLYSPITNHTYFYNFRNTPAFKAMRDGAAQGIEQLAGDLRNPRVSSAQKRAIRARIKYYKAVMNWTKTFGGGKTEGTLQHEVAHQVLFNLGLHAPQRNAESLVNPRWFAEGIASLFEPISDGKAANWGQMNKDRLDEFRQLVEYKKLFPVKEFVETIQPFLREDAGGVAYPQAWALCYYLSRTDRKGFKNYIELILERDHEFETSAEKELETFEKAFGKVDKNFEKRWLNWMKKVN